MSDDDFITCPDLHTCRNGAICREDDFDEGTYWCDCSGIDDNVYAGLSCEHQATVFCNPSNTMNGESFCTNGGTCIETEDNSGVHVGCDCPLDYSGDYCEYVADQNVPDGWGDSDVPADVSYGSKSTSTSAIVASVIVVVLAFIIGAMIAVWLRRRRFSEHLVVDKSKAMDLELDPDGATLSEGIASPAAASEGPEIDEEDAESTKDVI